MVFRFYVGMLCRIYEINVILLFNTSTKVRKLPSFFGNMLVDEKLKAKPIVSQTLECGLPQTIPVYGPRLGPEKLFCLF